MIKNGGYAFMNVIYPLLVQQFVDDYDLMNGLALDIGTGPGFLGIELAKSTDMNIHFFDIDSKILDKAKSRYSTLEFTNKVYFVNGDVQNMDYSDDSVDFIMSRGSMWFWEEQKQALNEIYRILKPGGVAIIGGGLGRYMPETMYNRIMPMMQKRLEKRNETRPSLDELRLLLKETNIKEFKVFSDGVNRSGRWIEIRK